ncbi:hypothetical protein BBJ29_008834 [Phytophthora kernoviae]|uniref:CBM1 domain-containing protein n=1 Tax=Phytophthora kernoviae TaxID=325452 RepID=A0A3F2RDA4_9STRA|nr:hypothetical protein BBJ29_008834 [Phytophthora kernoviae]RLN53757.1 hypothetical protein BBP00_00009204 [Phytophthora kernoviae]
MTKLYAITTFTATAILVLTTIKRVDAFNIRGDRHLDELRFGSESQSSGSDDFGSLDEGSGLPLSTQFAELEAWDQCGGDDFDYSSYVTEDTHTNANTKLDCEPGYSCVVVNSLFFQCQPLPDPSTVSKYGQCGGIGYIGNSECVRGLICVISDPWYAQCLPEGDTTEARRVDFSMKKKRFDANLLVEGGSDETDVAEAWEQCGGKGFNMSAVADDEVSMLPCEAGYACNVVNECAIRTRQYRAGDLADIARIFCETSLLLDDDKTFQHRWAAIVRECVATDLADIPSNYMISGGNFWVATTKTDDDQGDDGEIVGMAALQRKSQTEGEVKRVSVDTNHHRKGIGQVLMNHLEKWAIANGIKTLSLSTGVKSHKSLAFYASLGYELQKSDTFPTLFEDPAYFELCTLVKQF